jgi:hypothetical protein
MTNLCYVIHIIFLTIDESNYILEDVDYLAKYKCKLTDAVTRARANPCALLSGYNFCFTKHIQPPIANLSAIIKSSGGNVRILSFSHSCLVHTAQNLVKKLCI